MFPASDRSRWPRPLAVPTPAPSPLAVLAAPAPTLALRTAAPYPHSPGSPFWWITFTKTPEHLSFLRTKNPTFATKEKALEILRHYVDTFAVEGVVYNAATSQPEEM